MTLGQAVAGVALGLLAVAVVIVLGGLVEGLTCSRC